MEPVKPETRQTFGEATKPTASTNKNGTSHSTSTTDPKTKAGAGTAKPANTTKPGGGTDTPEPGREIPKLVTVTLPEPEPVKRGRGRPPGPSTKKETATPTTDPLLVANISAFLMGLFDLLSVRAGEHWKLKPVEAQGIALPVGNIIARNGLGETAGKYSDYIMLTVSLVAVIGPRVTKPKEDKGGPKNDRPTEQQPSEQTKQPGPKPGREYPVAVSSSIKGSIGGLA